MHVHWILVIAWVFCVGQHGVRSAIDTINWQGKHRINVYLAKRQKPTSNDPNEVRLQELWTQIQQLLYPSRLQKLGERPYDGESGSLQETIAGNIGAATGQSRTKLCRWSITPLNLRYQLMTRGKNHGSEWINFDFNFWISRELSTGWQTWYLEHSAKPTWICSSRCGVNARQADSLCSDSALTDEMCRDKFFRGYSRHNESLVIKNAFKIGWALKNTQEVWPEPRALGSAQKANKLITDTTKGI